MCVFVCVCVCVCVCVFVLNLGLAFNVSSYNRNAFNLTCDVITLNQEVQRSVGNFMLSEELVTKIAPAEALLVCIHSSCC